MVQIWFERGNIPQIQFFGSVGGAGGSIEAFFSSKGFPEFPEMF